MLCRGVPAVELAGFTADTAPVLQRDSPTAAMMGAMGRGGLIYRKAITECPSNPRPADLLQPESRTLRRDAFSQVASSMDECLSGGLIILDRPVPTGRRREVSQPCGLARRVASRASFVAKVLAGREENKT